VSATEPQPEPLPIDDYNAKAAVPTPVREEYEDQQ
jgi:hypothetical protein